MFQVSSYEKMKKRFLRIGVTKCINSERRKQCSAFSFKQTQHIDTVRFSYDQSMLQATRV